MARIKIVQNDEKKIKTGKQRVWKSNILRWMFLAIVLKIKNNLIIFFFLFDKKPLFCLAFFVGNRKIEEFVGLYMYISPPSPPLGDRKIKGGEMREEG